MRGSETAYLETTVDSNPQPSVSKTDALPCWKPQDSRLLLRHICDFEAVEEIPGGAQRIPSRRAKRGKGRVKWYGTRATIFV